MGYENKGQSDGKLQSLGAYNTYELCVNTRKLPLDELHCPSMFNSRPTRGNVGCTIFFWIGKVSLSLYFNGGRKKFAPAILLLGFLGPRPRAWNEIPARFSTRAERAARAPGLPAGVGGCRRAAIPDYWIYPPGPGISCLFIQDTI